MSTEPRTTEEHLKRIKLGITHVGLARRDAALESLTALREQFAELERKQVSPAIPPCAPESAANRESAAWKAELLRDLEPFATWVATWMLPPPDYAELFPQYATVTYGDVRKLAALHARLTAALPNPESPKEDAPASNGLSGVEVEVELRAQIAALTAEYAQFRENTAAAIAAEDRLESITDERISVLEEALRKIFELRLNPYCMTPSTDQEMSRALDSVRVLQIVRAALSTATPNTGSPSSPSVEPLDAANRESGASLLPLIRAAIDGYHHVAHCVECGEMSVDRCWEGRQAQEAIAALEAALPICDTSTERATDKGLPEKGAQ